MRRIGVTAAKAALLGTAVLLGGCSYNKTTTALNDGEARATDRLADAGAWIGAPWGRSRPALPEGSTTIARIGGAAQPLAPLRPEDGDVWPVPEAPRSTLANPDAAMRGIPNYRAGELDRQSGPAPRSQWQPTDPPLPPGLRSGASSPPPPPLSQPEFPPPTAAAPVPGTTAPPPRRADGRVITTPGGPAITTGGTDRIQSFVTPGGGTGTAINNGNTTTLVGPNGQVQTVPSR